MLSDNTYFEGASYQAAGESGEFELITRRINSLNRQDCGIVFGSLAFFTLMVAMAFAALGAWLILPFAGLEAVALYLAYRWIIRHADDSESLVIRGDAVVLEVREEARTRRFEFNRVWARLVVDQRAPSVRLALRSHGKEVEIGRYLDGGSRRMLARELKARLQAPDR